MDKYARFEAWLRENGARFEQLELREYDCGGGATTTTTAGRDHHHHDNDNDDNGSSSSNNDAMLLMSGGIGGGGGGEEKKETTMDAAEDDDEDDENSQGGRGDSEMRGVHARTMIPPNTICMSIPRRCLITVEMGQATPIGQAIFNSDLDLDAPKHIYLMVYILWDRKVHGRHSFFAPYYDILPQTLSNMPIFWSPQELQLLQGSYLLSQIADRNQAIAEDYHAICSIAPALAQLCTLEEFKWARMCVCSRNFGLQMDGHRTSALVPHADMLNHFRPRETKWTFDEDRNAFTITTLQVIPAGAQVYDSYGQKCNHRFLLNYGFAVEDNREIDGFCPNEVPLELFVDTDDPTYTSKLEFWTRGEQLLNHTPSVALPGGSASSSSVSHSLLLTQAVSKLQQQQQQQQQHDGRRQPYSSNNKNQTAITAAQTTQQQQQQQQSQSSQQQSSQQQHYSLPVAVASSSSSAAQNQHPIHHQRYAQHYPSSAASSFHANNSTMSSFCESSSSTIIKRIRVCVSNNENTRLLFSLLRTLACNEAELKAITRTTNHAHNGGNNSNNNNNGMGNSSLLLSSSSSNDRASAAALFGFPEPLRGSISNHQHQAMMMMMQQQQATMNNTHADPFAVLTGTPSPSAYYRSCRDLRHPLSLRNEKAAMQLLLDIVQRHLDIYPTTLEQDLQDLQDLQHYPRFSNPRHAKIQVRGEKQVLHHFRNWARTALMVLDVIQHELWRDATTNATAAAAAAVAQRGGIGGGSSSNSNRGGTATTSAASVGARMTMGVEVKLNSRTGQTTVASDEEEEVVLSPGISIGGSSSSAFTNFDQLIRHMEELHQQQDGDDYGCYSYYESAGDQMNSNIHYRPQHQQYGVHHTILRYCADVLGSLRREEMKNLVGRGGAGGGNTAGSSSSFMMVTSSPSAAAVTNNNATRNSSNNHNRNTSTPSAGSRSSFM